MAAVDGLLSLLVSQGADTLILVEGQVPELRKGDVPKPLSMPPLLPNLVGRFIDEVRAAGGGERYVFEGKGERTAFVVTIEGRERLELRRADALAASAEPAPDVPHADAAPRTAPRPAPRATAPVLDLEAAAAAARAVALVEEALAAEATDLFLSTSADARMRVGMALREVPGTRLDESALLALAGLSAAQLERLETHGSVDLGLQVGGTKVRINLFRHRGGLAAAVRPLRRVRTLAELNLPPDLARLVELPDGLVLLVGPSGSGKSSTIAALVDHLNDTQAKHVVTIEDPVELEHESRRCLIHQREVGADVESFAAGLRAALRESPDVIVVGEMRDQETFAAALTAAETGHLVLSTLHSGSAPMAIDRIIDSFPPHQQPQVRLQLASTLRAIVTQLLLPGTRPGTLVPAIERMVSTHAIAHKIREGRGHQIGDIIHAGRADGMVSLEASLADLVRRSQISPATARAAARNADLLRELLGP